MQKARKLWTPLSYVARRVRPSTCPVSLYTLNSFVQSSAFSSTKPARSRDSQRNFCGNLKFSDKRFSSLSAEKVDASRTCWNCDAAAVTAPFLVCGSCWTIQPVDFAVNYFQIFGLDRKYEIEVEGLEGKYKSLQKKLHPDVVHSKSEKEREYAAEQSARVIDAYRTLSKPLSRAIYILRLEGIDVDEEGTITDPELLAEIMEIREAVEDASDSQALNQIESEMLKKLEGLYNSFGNVFQSRNFDEAVSCIRRMTYYHRVNEEILKRL